MELNERFAGRGVTFVSIDREPRPRAASGFLESKGVVHAVLADPDGSTFEAYRVNGIPATVIVDRSGRVAYRHIGFTPGDEERFAREIEALLARTGTGT